MADGFLGRWSRRKIDAKEGRPLAPEPPAPRTETLAPSGPAGPTPAPATVARGADPVPSVPPAADAAPAPPTLDDVQALTPDSDFSRYTGSQVAPEVRNAAMKKLFADPHFNVMDGLDIYIDDYGKPDPLPRSMLEGLASAEFLGLVRKDPPPAQPARAQSATASDPLPESDPQFVAQSGPPEDTSLSATEPAARAPDADPDLRLQQDPAPGPQGPG
ncbi:MAG: hypothetical protein RI884_536 [Pseudomonadota bacterium]